MAEIKGIVLHNIDLTGISIDDQWEKQDEEEAEFLEACIDYENRKTEQNKAHMLEEFYDNIQANLGILEKYGISAEEVMKGYPKHLEKIKHRPREKKCSKCICCDAEEMWCEQDNSKTYEDYAKECRCYEEAEE